MNKYTKILFADYDDWKSTGLTVIVLSILLTLLNSFLFQLVLWLIRFGIGILIVLLVFRTGYLLYPVIKKKIEEK